MTEPASPPEKLVGALVSGIAILRYLRKARGPVSVTQTARELSLNPSTCYNLMRTLVHEGLANFDTATKSYTLSIGVVALAQGALDRDSRIRLMHPELARIARTHGVAMNLWQPVDFDRVMLVDRAEPEVALQISMRIGQRLPMLVGALGRCFAAFSDIPEAELRKRFRKVRLARPVDFETWLHEVRETRLRGSAVDEGNFATGVTTVSVPVFDGSGDMVMAVSAIAISAQLTGERIPALIAEMSAAFCDPSALEAARTDAAAAGVK